MLYNAALVLEGGAFRGQYTAGIVDTFLAHHIEFHSVIGVSAGSLVGLTLYPNNMVEQQILTLITVMTVNIFLWPAYLRNR